MTYNDEKYSIKTTPTFENEFENLYNYIRFRLKEPIIAEKFYNLVIEKLYSLEYLPARYSKIIIFNDKRNLHKLIINNYVVVYEINDMVKEINILHIYHSLENYLFNSFLD